MGPIASGVSTDLLMPPTYSSVIADNPRVENLWQYLKRKHGYRTGIVSTAAITDATPAVQGSYVAFRKRASRLLASTARTRCWAADRLLM